MKLDIFNNAGLACLFAALVLPTAVLANDHDEDDEDEVAFDVARIFYELNNTDGDLGIHAEIDGEGWKKLKIEGPKDRRMLKINVKGRLKKQGLTEIAFESAEPTFDELSPEAFFARFPEGEYSIEAETLEGDEMEAEVELSQVMPAPAGNIEISGQAAAEDCDADPLPSISGSVV